MVDRDTSEDDATQLIGEFEEMYVEDAELRRDFIISLYFCNNELSFSDEVDYGATPEAQLNARLGELQTTLRSATGRVQEMRGKLNEHAVLEYFGRFGYLTSRSDHKLDGLGIDVVANKADTTVFVQVKAGQISMVEIRKTLTNIKKVEVQNAKIISAFVAHSFPKGFEIERYSIEMEYGIPIYIVPVSAIIKVLPEYRNSA